MMDYSEKDPKSPLGSEPRDNTSGTCGEKPQSLDQLPGIPGASVFWKRRGETLAVFIDRIRHEEKLGAALLTYAGRLDPMADGLMLILWGDARFDKNTFLSLEKEYTFEVLFGIETDTFDVLGRIQDCNLQAPLTADFRRVIEDLKTRSLFYPPYSSKPIAGKPLFVHARNNTVPSVLPIQPGSIKELRYCGTRTAPLSAVVAAVTSDIQKVTGDFRQEEIIQDWELVASNGDPLVAFATFCATVTSGTYIRSIAHELGKSLGIPSLAYRITRTRIGQWQQEQDV